VNYWHSKEPTLGCTAALLPAMTDINASRFSIISTHAHYEQTTPHLKFQRCQNSKSHRMTLLANAQRSHAVK
jgi:hypothetical protein